MINAETGYCTFPNCPDKEDRQGFCIGHARHFAGPKAVKVKAPIAKESPKRKKEKKVLAVIKKGKMIELDGLCQLQGPNCDIYATDAEHIQKSSAGNYIDPNNITIACRTCNREKETHPEHFKKHIKSRFAK